MDPLEWLLFLLAMSLNWTGLLGDAAPLSSGFPCDPVEEVQSAFKSLALARWLCDSALFKCHIQMVTVLLPKAVAQLQFVTLGRLRIPYCP